MSKPGSQDDALLQRIIRRSGKVCREADQTLRDFASLQDLHRGDPAWAFLDEQAAWWTKAKNYAAGVLRQAQRKRREAHQ